MNKPITLIFCNDPNAGMAVAGQMRSEGVLSVQLRDAASFQGLLDDPADRVVIMPDVSTTKRLMISGVYRDAVQQLASPLNVIGCGCPDHRPVVIEKRRPGRPRKG